MFYTQIWEFLEKPDFHYDCEEEKRYTRPRSEPIFGKWLGDESFDIGFDQLWESHENIEQWL